MIDDKPLKYTLIRSARYSLAIQVTRDGGVVVRAPKRMPQYEIDKFVAEKRLWIEKHLHKMNVELDENPVRKLFEDELNALYDKALQVIPERVKIYAPKVGVSVNRITIRNQKTRWGSCSSKGNLNFNCLLMLTPIEVIDSVVVHELCHRLEMNHSKKFYDNIYRVYPEYDQWNRWLKENGSAIMRKAF